MSTLDLMYRAVLTVKQGDAGLVDNGDGLWYKEFTIPAVNVATSQLTQHPAERRIPSIPDPDLLLESRGAFVRLYSSTKLRLYWYGELDVDEDGNKEAISAYVEVLDLNDLSNDIKEILWRQLRQLGYTGEACIEDLIEVDTPGNVVSYRVRSFDTAAHAALATKDLVAGSGLELGELARYQVTVDIDKETNDRTGLIMKRVDALAVDPAQA